MIGLSDHIDLALIALYLFWVFFFGLVVWLNREGMREGFPVESEMTGKPVEAALLGVPQPKSFKIQDGIETTAPHPEKYQEAVTALPVAPFPGAPFEPVGDPMLSAFGAGAYAERLDIVLKTHHGNPKIAPMRSLSDFSIAEGDMDPRGFPVIAKDGETAGTVRDVWIDQEEQMIRYIEVELPNDTPNIEARRVLVPFTMCRVTWRSGFKGAVHEEVKVRSIKAAHFRYVPTTKNPDEVTLLEEDKITAFYGGGTLYADPKEREPLL
ncbi:MAG: photosynthetic reaction center subunit H [Pseudomonadota bacterium]